MNDCDIAIVGGGAAGSILAARLSEDESRRVVLIEAGRDTPPDAVPADIADLFPTAYANPAYFWPGLKAVWRAGGSDMPFPQARVMGGGSSVMGMWALRGVPEDYDAWRDLGAGGWGWSDVLPFFRKIERDLDFGGAMHGAEGPVPLRRTKVEDWPRYTHALADAAGKRGLPLLEDINADFRDGVFPIPLTNDGSGRVSSAMAYLTPQVRRRPNLVVMSQTQAGRILFSGQRVTGLELFRQGRATRLSCREIVVAAGAIGSPALLLRSGIGPAAELAGFGISPVADLPGVGRNLQNHCIVNFVARLAPQARQSETLLDYGVACARMSSGHPQGRRGDLQLQFITRSSRHAHGDRLGIVGAALYAPASRGAVSLRSADAAVPPRVEFRLLREDSDRQRLLVAAHTALALLRDPAVCRLRDDVFTVLPSSMVRRLNRPGILNRALSGGLALALDLPAPVRRLIAARAGRFVGEDADDRFSAEECLEAVSPIFHPAGTCAIGGNDDRYAVLDPLCRVRSIGGLRVIDASVMPQIPTGNTCLPTMMIAERAAAFL